ncbi:MAG: type II secretion system secretin GspD [Verrucomicrobia bacterium]|nr:type II secretion system secretin GspD [Verrucomicrobiota bacterium]
MKRALFLLLVVLSGFGGSFGVAEESKESALVNFSFDHADIHLLVQLVGDMTGKRFVVDDAVTGKVTIITPGRIPIDEVYPLFLSVLESSGYSVVNQGAVLHLVPLPEGRFSAGTVLGPDETVSSGGVVTKVIKVNHISVLDLKKSIDALTDQGKAVRLAAFPPSNHLIVTDVSDNVERLEKIISELDKPGAARVVEIVPLEYASAEEVAIQVMAALSGAEGAGSKLSKRMQKVTTGAADLPDEALVVPATHANQLVLVGTPVQLGELKRIVSELDVESPSGRGRLNVIFMKYLPATEAAESLNALLAKSVGKEEQQKIAIEPSVPNNALLVDASPRDFEIVKELVAQLDNSPEQVLVQILIAEVSEGADLDLGVSWSTIDAPEAGKTTVIGRSRPEDPDLIGSVMDSVFPQGLTFGVAEGTYVDAAGNVLPRIPFLIQALSQNRNVDILSNIPLWAQNNKEASVSVVDNIPILRSTVEGGSGTARDIIQNIDRVDVGIKLKLTPHVNPDGEVQLDLNPSIEAIIDEGPADTQFAPSIAKREVSTTVTVPNNATVVISGLIREDRIETTSKVPLLGDIPLIGVLFRHRSTRSQRTNLLMFVTPHIVTDMAEAKAVQAALQEKAGIQAPEDEYDVHAPVGE